MSILTVRQTLAPLRLLSRMAHAIGPGTTAMRLPLGGVPREVAPLVSAMNDVLDRLEDGFRLQREFTADAAHELRTPLAVLAAHIDTLSERSAAKELRRDLDGMTNLVEQLLRVAQAEALVVPPGSVTDLAELACDVAAFLGPMAVRAHRRIEVEAPDEPVPVNGQVDALFHAVRNLADNALRHTPAETAVILRVEAAPPSLSVSDRGPGIPLECRKLIFQRFWRAERRGSGSGLGLAIVQRTMAAHGGTVIVEDAVDGGACFQLVFPDPLQTAPMAAGGAPHVRS